MPNKAVAAGGTAAIATSCRVMPDSVVEHVDDRVRQARELVERGNDLIRLFRLDYIERYSRGYLALAIRRELPEEANYGFLIFARSHIAGWNKVIPGKCPFGDKINHDQIAVLPHDVEMVEGIERFVPSLIRFQRFDDRFFGCGQPLYEFASFVPPTCENSGALGYRKIGFVVPTYAVANGQCSRENIEAATNDVDVGAKLDVERERERAFLDRYYPVVRRWRWRLFKADFDVVGEPGCNPLSEGWELGIGPINARLSIEEVGAHGCP